MTEFSLPTDLNTQWASAGDILKPTDTKIQQGWAPEIPPRQWFNWLDNRQDQAIAHIAQHGISVWSSTLEYQAGKSYVQGSDGLVYKAVTTHTNINPVGGAPGNWESAFITATTATQVATAAQSRAMTANNVYLSPLQLANAFSGSSQQLLSGTGFQKLPGGLILMWGTSGSIVPDTFFTVNLPLVVPNSILCISCSDSGQDTAQVAAWTTNFNASIKSSFQLKYHAILNTTDAKFCNWIAIAY